MCFVVPSFAPSNYIFASYIINFIYETLGRTFIRNTYLYCHHYRKGSLWEISYIVLDKRESLASFHKHPSPTTFRVIGVSKPPREINR